MNTNPSQAAASNAEKRQESLARYWRSNLRILFVLLTLWAVLGLGCGILFADVLNQFQLGGYPLGFWFAQQGSIAGFVVLIFIYCMLMNGLDAKHHRELEALDEGSESGPRPNAKGGTR